MQQMIDLALSCPDSREIYIASDGAHLRMEAKVVRSEAYMAGVGVEEAGDA